MKKALLGLGIVVLLIALFIGYLLVNTSAYKSKQIVKADGQPRIFTVDEAAVQHLSQAIQIRTISYDDSVGHKLENFDSFYHFLQVTYPTAFSVLEDTVINGSSILLKWKGADQSAKPAIFYAHLDVVPIEENTKDKWKQDPFGGAVVDGTIWGRGALDDKGSFISLLEATEKLAKQGFVPGRNIYFAFGSDEEIGGKGGAAMIAEYFRKQGTKFEFYVDEGGMVSEGLVPNIKKPVALIGTAEKGYITLELSVRLPGGHSSRPPKRTALGVLNKAIYKINNYKFNRHIAPSVSDFLDYVGPEMPMPLKVVFANRSIFKPIILAQYEKSAEGNALVHTTGITTVMNAGVKENVIPSLVTAKVNFRILPGETVAEVTEEITKLVNDTSVIIKQGEIFEPSNSSSADAIGFKLLQQTCAEVFPDAYVAPFLMLGSTDSKHFNDLCDNIYRFFPTRMDSELIGTIHGINERITVKGYMETIAFYETFLLKLK